MFFFSSLKCILWVFEHYEPEKCIEINDKKYISENSANNVIEIYFVPIFIFLIMNPLAYIPIPFLSFFIYSSSVILGIATMTNKIYRQRFCVFIRDLFVNKSTYVAGNEGEVHKLLQTICFSMEYAFNNTYRISSSLKNIINKNDVEPVKEE